MKRIYLFVPEDSSGIRYEWDGPLTDVVRVMIQAYYGWTRIDTLHLAPPPPHLSWGDADVASFLAAYHAERVEK